MRLTICNWWKSWDHQRQLMQIIGLNIGGALSRLASQQEASQENWFNLLNSAKVLAKSWYRGRLFVYFTFPMAVDILPMPTASSVDFARARPSTICREEEEERARRGALSTAQFSNTVIVGSYLIWFYPRKIEPGLVIPKIQAKSGGTKLSDCKVEFCTEKTTFLPEMKILEKYASGS